MAVTLKDIAKVVGVRESTVSRVLNNTPNPIRISDVTREKIRKVADELGYHPNAAARALSTRKTGQIGFILSDSVTGGWANAFYAQQLGGVEQACRSRGYGLLVSMYNLSNIETFVVPRKVGQRNVDGIVLTGYVQKAVLERFRKFDIPCVCIHENVEGERVIPTIGSDLVGGRLEAVKFVAKLGHKRILHDAGYFPSSRRRGEQLIQQVRESTETSGCEVSLVDIPGNQSDYKLAKPLMEYWLSLPVSKRPTVIIASDQTLQAFLKEMTRHGLNCPGDISLISNCDTPICQLSTPSLTAIQICTRELGQAAAEMLIGSLETKTSLTPAMSRNDFSCGLVVRESCTDVGS